MRLCFIGIHKLKYNKDRCSKKCERCNKNFKEGRWHQFSPWKGTKIKVHNSYLGKYWATEEDGQSRQCQNCGTMDYRQ